MHLFVHPKTDSVTLPLFCYWQFTAFGVQKPRTIKKMYAFSFAFFITNSRWVFAESWIARSDRVGQSGICSLCSFKLFYTNTSV